MLTANRIFLVFALLVFGSCAKNRHQVGSVDEPKVVWSGENWKNPHLEHSLSLREDPFQTFPFDPELTDAERIDSLGFSTFIQRMNSSFSESELSMEEANLIYSILQKSEFLGAPESSSNVDPRYPAPDKMTVDKLKERTAVKRLNGQPDYGLFYKYYQCGWKYSHVEIAVSFSDSLMTQIKEVESWVARTPC